MWLLNCNKLCLYFLNTNIANMIFFSCREKRERNTFLLVTDCVWVSGILGEFWFDTNGWGIEWDEIEWGLMCELQEEGQNEKILISQDISLLYYRLWGLKINQTRFTLSSRYMLLTIIYSNSHDTSNALRIIFKLSHH
jgi:hypothetical protein